MPGGSHRALLVAALGFSSAFETTPFLAVQVAAWQTLART